jgi:hypothetical protein|tara:strand:- start:26 stop:229 length:204 start_codon:yes stop_codon:yes gene_type:complete
MKVGDLVRLNEVLQHHPAYKNKDIYVVKRVLGGYKDDEASKLVELFTPSGKLVAYNMLTLELLSESR